MKKIVIKFKDDFRPGSGACSEAGWNNPDVKKALEKLFALRKNEQIVGLEISEDRIKAWFEFGLKLAEPCSSCGALTDSDNGFCSNCRIDKLANKKK